MFRDPRPMALWRDSILFWCRVTRANSDLGLALWKAALPPSRAVQTALAPRPRPTAAKPRAIPPAWPRPTPARTVKPA